MDFAFEQAGNDQHPEMAPAVLGPLVAGVQVTFIFDTQRLGVEGLFQAAGDLSFALLRIHNGITLLNGVTSTDSYTPAAT